MSLRLITGRSGSGKTRFALDEIRTLLREDPGGSPLLLIVPEQATFQAEYELATTPGLAGFLRAQVLSFRRLAFRVMQETGGSAVVPINDNGKSMLIHKALIRHRDRLRLYRSGASAPGLAGKIGEVLTEWKRYGADADRLAEAAAAGAGADLLADKLHDLALVYGEVERELAGRWLDGEDMLARLAAGAGASALLAGARIWLDGFHGFTPQEYEVVRALLATADRVSVALCLDRPYGSGETPDELALFHATAETSRKLCELAEQAGVSIEPAVRLAPAVPPRFAGSPMLAHLEEAVVTGRRWPGEPETLRPTHPLCGLSLHAAANPRAEAEAIARDMRRRAREEGARWRDMAVFVRKLDDYADVIGAVFADYGIPYFLDGKAAASHHPLVELIRSALETVLYGWRTEALLRCAKTDLLQPADGDALAREDVDALENYVLAAGIDGWRWHDDRQWRPLHRRDLEDDRLSEAEEQAAERRRQARDALLSPLRRLEARLQAAETFRELAEALLELLENIGAADRLERWSEEDAASGDPARARLHRPLWDGVMDLLDQVVELMGDQPADPKLFAGMMDAGLEQLRLGAVPPTLDNVLVGSPERTRIGGAAIVYLLGVSDGVMPMAIREDGLLSEAERERLASVGVQMAPGARRRLLDEEYLIYLALTSPSRHLWVSYPLADEEGQGLLPSPYIRRLRKWFPGLPETQEALEPQAADDEARQLAHAQHPGRALTHLVARLRRWRQGEPMPAGWWSVYRWLQEREAWRPRLARLLASLHYTNAEAPLTERTSRLLYGERLLASVSRLERFVSCPFRHFASHGLRLQPRRLYRVDAPDIGQLFHAALRQTTEKLLAGGGPEDWRLEAAAAVESLLPRLQSQILLSSHRHRAMARKLRDIVLRSSAMLGEHARLSAFRPVGLEVGFGPNDPIPPLTIGLGDGRFMDLAGRIDRVDAAETPAGVLLRVMDYKSGDARLRLDEVAHGLSLQMLAYLDVVVTHAPHWLGRPAEPAGVLYFHVHNPLLHTANGLSAAESAAAMAREFRMQGLVLADRDAVTLMDATLRDGGKSSVLPVELKKDGQFSARAQVADRLQWDVLRRAVRGNIRRIGRRIADGDVSIAPYRMNRKSPCDICEFRPVCQFDAQMEGNRYETLRKAEDKEQLWQRLAERGEGGTER